MQTLINMLKKDDNTVSVGRFCAVISFLVWLGVSLYLACVNKVWGSYETFSLTVLGYVLVQLGNKAIETKVFKVGGGSNG